jgi:uncharacterized protein YcfJ
MNFLSTPSALATQRGKTRTMSHSGAIGLAALSVMGLMAAQQATAQEAVGRVISSTALITQVSVPRQVCAQEVVQTQTPAVVQQGHNGAGALMGAIAGGAVGNSIGSGSGRAAATALGIFGGLILGDKLGTTDTVVQAPTITQQTVNRCSTQNTLENRTTGYQVVYEYAGKQYSVQLANDPGPTIPLQVMPVAPALAPTQAAPARVVSQVEVAPPVVTTVISSGTVYQPYLVPAVTYVEPAVNIGFGYNYYHQRRRFHHFD